MEDGRIPLLREVKCNLSVPSSYPIKYQYQGSQKRLAFLDLILVKWISNNFIFDGEKSEIEH